MTDPNTYVNTVLIALVGGLVSWFAQDMRKRVSNIERRLGASIRAFFYLVSSDLKEVPEETLRSLEDAMKETK